MQILQHVKQNDSLNENTLLDITEYTSDPSIQSTLIYFQNLFYWIITGVLFISLCFLNSLIPAFWKGQSGQLYSIKEGLKEKHTVVSLLRYKWAQLMKCIYLCIYTPLFSLMGIQAGLQYRSPLCHFARWWNLLGSEILVWFAK